MGLEKKIGVERGTGRNTYFVIMAGGKGERFWPISTELVPKPFIGLIGKKTLIELTVERAKKTVPVENIFIVLGKEHLPVAKACLPGLPDKNFVVEPVGRDTAPCIGLAASIVMSADPDAVMVVLPSDHFVPDEKHFTALIKKAIKIARSSDDLITIGITPDRPETGYGYIKRGKPVSLLRGTESFHVDRYVEKPDIAKARRYIREGGYYWNAGIFVWRAAVLLDAMKLHMPGMYEGIMEFQKAAGSKKFKKAGAIFAGLQKVSIDYGLMEKARNVLVIPASFSWDDIGTWTALHRVLPADKDGNVIVGNAVVLDTSNCVVISGEKPVAVLGMSDSIVIASDNGILVCDASRVQDVRRVTRAIQEKLLKK
ncbi:MAG: Mannose-phosphate guanylyltransferase [Deltaproteobacteria bacterium]|nr:Mannose-phosphate guanylyltransferase [Deltaproteobacteria bacterium]